MKIKNTYILLLLFLCCTSLPKSFKQTNEPNWATVKLRDDITYESAWRSVVDLVVQKFDTEVLDQKEGYIRTKYLDSYSSVVTGIYRVKLVIKFSKKRDIVVDLLEKYLEKNLSEFVIIK